MVAGQVSPALRTLRDAAVVAAKRGVITTRKSDYKRWPKPPFLSTDDYKQKADYRLQRIRQNLRQQKKRRTENAACLQTTTKDFPFVDSFVVRKKRVFMQVFWFCLRCLQ
nr:MAG TPA: hypothetical protein [Caudoviricetes sp.]